MKTYSRAERVSGKIRKVLSELIQKEVNDPRLQMAIITGVNVSRDLKSAKVFFTTTGNKTTKEETQEGFQSAIGFIKRELARRLELRYMPDIKFYHDDSFDYGSRIDSVLKTLETDHAPNHTITEEE